MDASVVVQSAAYLGLLSVGVYFALRGQKSGRASLRLKVAGFSGLFVVASLVALVTAESTTGSLSSACMIVFAVSLGLGSVLLIAAMCIPSGI